MDITSKKELKALALLVVGVLVLEFIFGGISVQIKTALSKVQGQQAAAASACSNESFGNLSGSIKIPHEICKNPKATTCGVVSLGAAGNIGTVCTAGCCKAAGYSAAPGIKVTGNGLVDGLLSNVAMQFISQAISGIFGGGSGGSSSGSSYDGGFRNAAEEEAYLKFNTEGVGEEVDVDTFDLIFGTGGTTNEDPTTPLTYGTNNDTQQSDSNSSTGSTNTTGSAAKPGDTVTTSYESLTGKTVVSTSGEVAAIPGEEGFEQDFFGSTLSTSEDIEYGDRLTVNDLEYSAEQERRREALLYEQEGSERAEGIEDYRSSNIAQSKTPVEVNPLSNSRYDDLEYDSGNGQDATWWHKLVLLIGRLLGLSS